MNGQHSSHVLDNLENGKFPTGLKAVILEFDCESEQDMCELFAEFDPRKCARSVGDITKAHASIHSKLSDIPEGALVWVCAGIAFAMNKGVKAKRVTADDRARLIHNNQSFVLFASQLARRPGFRKVGVSGAIFSTWSRDSDAAEKFWNWVARQSHINPEHTSRMLARFLLQTTGAARRTVTPNEFYAKCIYAWNAWRRGDAIASLRYLEKAPTPTPV